MRGAPSDSVLDMVIHLATACGGIFDLLPFFALLGFAIAGPVLVIVTLVLPQPTQHALFKLDRLLMEVDEANVPISK